MKDHKFIYQKPLYISFLPDYDKVNSQLLKAFFREKNGPFSRHSHFELNRFENIYIQESVLPEIEPLKLHILTEAKKILKKNNLKYGFWFNEMNNGDLTVRHNHEEKNELLSCVYYLQIASNCGDLLIYYDDAIERIKPEEGKIIFFRPSLHHEVEENKSKKSRISIAFNFGIMGE